MSKAKFWLVQIALVAIVGLVLGSPALADKPGFAGSAEKPGFAGQTGTPDHANANSDGTGNKGGNGGGKSQGDETGNTDQDPAPVCSKETKDIPGVCTAENCAPAGGTWGQDGVCYFFGG